MMTMTVNKPNPVIDRTVYDKYLKLYNADIDWLPHLEILSNRLKASGGDDVRLRLHNQASCTVLLPTHDRTVIQDPPEKLLFVVHKFSQFPARDWFSDLTKIVAQDAANLQVRQQAIDFGVIYPVHYNPRARQAFHWLMDEALKSPTTDGMDETVIRDKMEKLVLYYGGAVICNVFNKPEYHKKIGNILNWRTGYFFERLIYEVYKPDEILKIKLHDIKEIERQRPELIKKVKV